ncbi:MAG: hypothetical protein WC178_00795 [Candidatus Paceibacterota bacterium]
MEKDFSQEILEKIKTEQIKPKSRWLFVFKNSLVWLIFGASIILGALSFSVILHFWEINDWDVSYRLSENFLTFVILTMPYFWLICFLAFLGLAYLYLKNTKTGYRYEFAKILVLSLALSFVIGGLLYSIGAGRQTESEFAARAPFYKNIKNNQEEIWFQPERGVIAGKVLTILENGEILELDDPHHVVWTVDASDAEYFREFIVKEGFMIKVFGKVGDEKNLFVAEEIRPLVRNEDPKFRVFSSVSEGK